MGAISIETSSSLYWLGRYTERVFTTLNSFFRYYDKMLDGGPEISYQTYLNWLSIPDIYGSTERFFDCYLFDKENPDSIRSNFERALGNGTVVREKIKTPSLSYLQLALDSFKKCRGTEKVRYDLLPVRDRIYAFWGSVESNMTDIEARDILMFGQAVERMDLYFRFSLPFESISSEFEILDDLIQKNIRRVPDLFDIKCYNGLKDVIEMGDNWTDCRNEAICCLERLYEEPTFENTAVLL
ncbi:MAG: alpha-E domain-containing protein [Huintestinicola sp.]